MRVFHLRSVYLTTATVCWWPPPVLYAAFSCSLPTSTLCAPCPLATPPSTKATPQPHLVAAVAAPCVGLIFVYHHSYCGLVTTPLAVCSILLGFCNLRVILVHPHLVTRTIVCLGQLHGAYMSNTAKKGLVANKQTACTLGSIVLG
jgi:hypothetical protein